MRRLTSANCIKARSIGILSAVVVGLICAMQIEVSANEKWTRIRSKNFELIGNANEKDIRRVATKLEQFRLVFSKVYDKFDFESDIPTSVIVFKDQKSFRQFKPVSNGKVKDWVAGFFQSGPEVNYIAVSVKSRSNDTYQIIFHEYTHFLIENTFKRAKIPSWLNEGLAEYYDNLEILDESKVRLGNAKMSHLRTLQNKQFIPIEKFFDDKFALLENQSDETISLFYSQSWALIHYLIHGNSGKRKPQLLNFLDLLIEGKDAKNAFASAFSAEYQEIEAALKIYIAQSSLSSTTVQLDEKLNFNSEMEVSVISEAKAKSFQGDLLYRMNRLDEANEILREALSLNPNEELANITLGLVNIKKGEFEQAAKNFKNAIANGSKNYVTHYYYAFVLSRSTINSLGIIDSYNPSTANDMRTSLRNAISLNPKFADSYNLYALISIVQNEELEIGLEMIDHALQLSPKNLMFQLRRSELLLRKKDFSASRAIAAEVYEKEIDQTIREFAKNLLEKIEDIENQNEFSNQIREANLYVVREDRPLTDQELAELNRRIEIDSINKNLRKPKKGEIRILGRVTKIDCAKKGVIFSVKSLEKDYSFASKTFKELVFYTYQIQLKGGEIGCESDLRNFYSIITYRDSAGAFGGTDGEIVSIEFVPDYFVFRESAP